MTKGGGEKADWGKLGVGGRSGSVIQYRVKVEHRRKAYPSEVIHQRELPIALEE